LLASIDGFNHIGCLFADPLHYALQVLNGRNTLIILIREIGFEVIIIVMWWSLCNQVGRADLISDTASTRAFFQAILLGVSRSGI
jgi:hypothetical protein